MNLWDWIALFTGVLGVILTIFQTIWCWPVALISVVISSIEFYNQRLFGDMSLNIFYFFSGIYGWFYWSKYKNVEFKVSKMPKPWFLYSILLIVFQSVIYFFILNYYKSDQIIIDAILTACSFTCTYLMTKKWLENWLIWILIDASYVILYIIKEMPTYAMLYSFFTIMAAYGFYQWKTQIIKEA